MSGCFPTILWVVGSKTFGPMTIRVGHVNCWLKAIALDRVSLMLVGSWGIS